MPDGTIEIKRKGKEQKVVKVQVSLNEYLGSKTIIMVTDGSKGRKKLHSQKQHFHYDEE